MRFLFFFMLLGLFAQCSPKTSASLNSEHKKQMKPELAWQGLQKLKGIWYDQGMKIYETWEDNGNFNLKGADYDLDVAGNRLVSERLRLAYATDGTITYTATLIKENAGKATSFVLTEATSDSFTFENPTHDFPKKIVYKVISDQAMDATISAGEKYLTFHFKRTEEPRL
jgi:hypothetical protein